MKLINLEIFSAPTCGGLLDGLSIRLRDDNVEYFEFDPLCFVGPNGAGKSQVIQVLAEALQVICHANAPTQERNESNPWLEFSLEYLISAKDDAEPTRVRACRKRESSQKAPFLAMAEFRAGTWVDCRIGSRRARQLLPSRIIGYTSGDNETLSLPFLASRSGYADQVATSALSVNEDERKREIDDTRLHLIDYGTNLEVLTSNLLLGADEVRAALLRDARVKDFHSCRCVIQLAHAAVPKASAKLLKLTGRKGIQITPELEGYIDALKNCSTCYDYDDKTEKYTFDFWVNSATRECFNAYWKSVHDLFLAMHKIAMLNDLAIPRETRLRFRKEASERRFASRMPEPQDEQKVFRYEQVRFQPLEGNQPVDYVSLSDGEHQLGQLLGTLSMQHFPGTIFLLDEPESHFNPQWRAKAITRIRELPTRDGSRSKAGKNGPNAQECILTTHAPFVLSDVRRERVFIFSKEDGQIKVRHPDIETYGAPFDTLLGECFGVAPPISEWSLADIGRLRDSNDPNEIEEALPGIGSSAQKAFLFDRLRQLRKNGGGQ